MRHARQRRSATHRRAVAAGSALVLAGSLGASAAYAQPEDLRPVVQVEAVALDVDGLTRLTVPAGDAAIDLVVSEVFVEPGAGVAPGDVILTVAEETDLGTVQAALTAPLEGTLTLEVEVGDVVHAGDELGTLAAIDVVDVAARVAGTGEPGTEVPAVEELATEEQAAEPGTEAPATEAPGTEELAPLVEPLEPAFEVTDEAAAPLLAPDALEITPLALGPETGITTPYLMWDVKSGNTLVGGATFTLQGPRTGNNANGSWGTVLPVIVDCTGACGSTSARWVDLDPDPGEFQVRVTATSGTTSNQRYRLQMTTTPAGYVDTTTGADSGWWYNGGGNGNTVAGWQSWRFPATTAGSAFTLVPDTTTASVTVRSRAFANPTTVANPTGTNNTNETNIGSDYRNTEGAAFELFTYTTYDAGPQVATGYTCTIVSGGECAISVPNASSTNLNKQFWVVEKASAPGTYSNSYLLVGSYSNPLGVRHLVGLTKPITASSQQYLPMVARVAGTQQFTALSTGEFPTGSGTLAEGASFGAVTSAKSNPTIPRRCDEPTRPRIALALDQSQSISQTQWTTFRDAIVSGSNSLLGTLASTNASVSVIGFGNSAGWLNARTAQAPGGSVVRNYLTQGPLPVAGNESSIANGIPVTHNGGRTNWDDGMSQLAAANYNTIHDYDVVLFVTDGAPNYVFGSPGTAVAGDNVGLRSLEAPIFAANDLKNQGVRIITIGVGNGINGAGVNLRAVSGPVPSSDYYQTANWDLLKQQLSDIAKATTCQVPINVSKTTVDAAGVTTVKAGGWTFGAALTASGATLEGNASQTPTAGNGASWTVRFPSETATASVTITETAKPGWTLDSVTCNGDPVAFTQSPGSITLTGLVANSGTYDCVFTNKQLPTSLTLIKQVTNDNGGTSVVGDWTLTATGPTTGITGKTGEAAVTSRLVTAGTYTLSEVGPTGWAGAYTASWSCTGGTLSGTSVTIAQYANVVCTVVNNDRPATLTLVKAVTNDNGGTSVIADWTLTATGTSANASPSITGKTGAATVTNASVNAGTYTLSETGAQSAGYTPSWACTAGTLTGTSLTLANGQSATCTVTNNDIPAVLTLVKVVDNTNGGTSVIGDWTLTATGTSTNATPSITGITGAATVTNANVNAGTYTLSESGAQSAGYTPSWSCTAGTLAGTSLTLTNGQSATCTVTNTARAATLTLIKTVVNDHGGTSVASDWTLTATPAPAITGQGPVTGTPTGSALTGTAVNAVTVKAGTYALTELAAAPLPSQYAATWLCVGGTLSGTSVTVGLGANVVCTVTNDDIAPRLTLIKAVTNDHGGTSNPSHWTLTATPQAPLTGPSVSGTPSTTSSPGTAVNAVAVRAGTYALTEAVAAGAPAGLTASQYAASYACSTGFGGTQTSPTVTLTPGQNVTCTVTNDDKPVTLTLVKTVINDNGGTALPGAWLLLAVNSQSAVSGPSGATASLAAGTTNLYEGNGPAGYEPQGWSCPGATVTPDPADPSNASVVLVNGASITCTVTNNDIAPTLTLVKTVVNNHGGASVASDWTLTATPTPVIVGQGAVGGTSAAGTALTGTALSAQAVKVGTYSLTETAAGTLPSQYAESWSCVIDSGAAVSGSSITLGLGQNATCTATNDDKPVTLTLVKNVINDNGGTAGANTWLLTASGPRDIVAGVSETIYQNLGAGTYALSEAGPAGYTPQGWFCPGATVTPNPTYPTDLSKASVDLVNGANVTCTVTNNDNVAGLSVEKRAWTGAVTPAVGNAGAPALSPAPGQTLTERAAGVSLPAGTAVTWSYTVTNSGGVPLTGVTVTDDRKTGAVCTVPGTLAVGASFTCYWEAPLARIP